MKKFLVPLCCLIVTAILSSAMYVLAGSDGSPDGYDTWEDFYNSLTGNVTAEQSEYVPSLTEMKKVSEKNGVSLYFYEKENIFYFSDSNGKLWSSIIKPDYITAENSDFSEKRALFSVKLADSENSVITVDAISGSSEGFSISCDYGNDSVTLHLISEEYRIGFDAVIGLDKYGVYCTIPSGSISETGNYNIISVAVLPALAVARISEDGYIAYTDGCGALMDFSGRATQNKESYTYEVWGSEEADLDTILENQTDDIHSLMLPIFGMKHSSGGMLAAITAGEEIASLTVTHSDYYSAYFTLNYRTFYSAEYNFTDSVFDKKQITKLSSLRASDTDCTVRWFLLSGDKNTYSDMAGIYRNYLIESGVLKENIKDKSIIPISLDIFMSIEKSGIFGNSLNTLTSATDALDMIKYLEDNGVNGIDVLLKGWSKGGYTAMPTAVGNGKLDKLKEYCDEKGISLYREAEFIMAYGDAGGYNSKKDVLRDCIKQIITDKDEERLILSPDSVMLNSVEKWNKSDKSNICFSTLGSLLLSGFKEKNEIGRSDALKAYKTALEKVTSCVAVSGGNSYVLPYADRLYDIPDTDSAYYQNTRSIPLYQMVVHSSVNYSSLAANRSYDLQYQKLKWLETGSIPHYFVTEKDATEFQDTDYDTVFSSKFSDYSDIIVEISKEFNENFGDFWYQPITRHEYLTDDVIRVVYGDSNAVLLNYGDKEAEINGVKLAANSYAVLKGGE